MYRDIFQIDRYSSNLSKIYRIWHLKGFKNLGLLKWQWVTSTPGSTSLLQEDDGYQRDSSWSLLAIWARNFFPWLLGVMLYDLDMQDLHRNDCWTCLKVRLLLDNGLYPVTCILNKYWLASSQAVSIGGTTRQELEAGQWKYLEEESFSLQSSPREREAARHRKSEMWLPCWKRYKATWLTQTRIMG